MSGGICYIAKRFSKANNKYQYLPYGRFKWLNKKEIDKLLSNSIEKNSPIGYILEDVLEYLDELHELHNDYPISSRKT